MAYPPPSLPTDKQDNTPSAADHPQHHNALASAVNDIVAALGTTPQGGSATLSARLSGIETTVSGISGGTDPETVRDIVGATLVAGTNVTIAVDDPGDTITINAALASGTGNGGYGPNWIAASDAPSAVKTAVSAAGGTVIASLGTNAATAINSALSSYKNVSLTEGTFSIASTITMVHGATLQGSGNPATTLKCVSGVTGRVIYATVDKVTIRDLLILGAGVGTSVAGIEVNVTSNSGFFSQQTQEACTIITNVQIDGVTGDGVIMAGTYNRDTKLYNVDCHNVGGNGFTINCPDGTAQQCVAGSPGKHGFNIDGASNWRFTNCKSWYAVNCGWIIGETSSTARIGLIGCEAQDNKEAGFRVVKANAPTLTGCIADSNSNTSGNSGVYSGFEIFTTGSTSGGYPGGGVVMSGCVAYDKNEGGRGYRQAYGFRFGTGLRYASVMGCGCGDNNNHHNATGAVLFNTTSDSTHSSNVILMNASGTLVKSF